MQPGRVQETAVSALLLALWFGVVRIRHAVPFHASASVWPEAWTSGEIVPTAMQRAELVQDTPDSSTNEPAGAGIAVGCQLWPSHLAAFEKLVAMQNDADTHDTAPSWPRGRLAVGMACQVRPFQSTAIGAVPSPLGPGAPPTATQRLALRHETADSSPSRPGLRTVRHRRPFQISARTASSSVPLM